MTSWIAIALTVAGVTPFPVATGAVDLGELRTCAALEADAERLACYDALAGRLERALEEGEPVSVPQVPSEDLFGLPGSGPPTPEQVTARIERLTSTTRGKLVITLDNGQVWHQVDSRRSTLDDGTSVVIRKAALGSFLLHAEESSRGIRVKRVK